MNVMTSGSDANAEDGLNLNDVSRKIRGAMQERGRRRKNESVDEIGGNEDSEGDGSGISTPASSVGDLTLGPYEKKRT